MKKRKTFAIIIISILTFGLLASKTQATTQTYQVTNGFSVLGGTPGNGNTLYYQNFPINYTLGHITISGDPTGTQSANVGDMLQVINTTPSLSQNIFTYQSYNESNCSKRPLPPTDITYLFKPGLNNTLVKFSNWCADSKTITSVYLTYEQDDPPTPTPTPTATPTPSPTSTPTPQPFLDLPWDYKAKGKSFNDVAMAINSFFDHTFPLLSAGFLHEPAIFSNQVTTYQGENSTQKDYSSHDGYDYGLRAGVNDSDVVLAAASGTATFVPEKNSGGGGNVIKIDHGNGYQSWYLHLYPTDLVIASEGGKVRVEKGQQIGKVGHTGNCYVIDSKGNRIYNTPACAHIHFGVIQDKNHDGSFGDNIPDGLTDPFGWEPMKVEAKKDPDPWESYSFFYKDQQRTGNKSYYLWKTKLGEITDYIATSGGELKLGYYDLQFQPNSTATPVTIHLESAPLIQTTLDGKKYRSIGTTLAASMQDTLGTILTGLFNSFLLTIDFSQTTTANIKPETISVYSTEDGTWNKENTTINMTNHKATASINHFSQFALMGEVADTTSPITSAQLEGAQGNPNWFRSDVQISLNAKDNDSGLGVDSTQYKKDNDDWATYTEPITFIDEGHHKLEYYSEDKDGNIEDIKTREFDIDKTPPEAKIQFDISTQELQVIGQDNSGQPSTLQTNQNKKTEQIIITDSAGNTLLLTDTDRDHGAKATMTLTSLIYNNNTTIPLDTNKLTIHYTTDQTDNLKTFEQQYELRGQTKLHLSYNIQTNQTIIATDKQKTYIEGMKLLQLMTQNGKLNYNY